MAEELNDQNNEEAGNSHEETAIDQKKKVCRCIRNIQKNQCLLEVQTKATKSATDWAVNTFKGRETQ